MALLAHRNLFYDKARFAVTLAGIVFAIVLVVIQLGLFIGFTVATSAVIDRSGADLWIAAKGVQYFEVAFPLSERKLFLTLGTPGVASADKLIVRFTNWRRPDGAETNVVVVGFNPDTRTGGPWNLIAGSHEDLKIADTVIVDDFYREDLGVRELGQHVEINNRRARVVGLTQGIRSFTTTPFVFTSFKNALNYTSTAEDETMFVLARAAPGVPLEVVQARLKERLGDVDVFTRQEFSDRTRHYWLFTTGAGIALLVAAMVGLLVGLVVVAQTIYATTVDHLREFGTLKAIGASNAYVYAVIVQQAVWSAIAGYGLGMAAAFAVIRLSRRAGATILVPWQLTVGMFGLALLMCVGASLVSVHKVTRLDPAEVFRE
jgi:putative ABC transport system permease protein